jgi:hypothetical protein
LDAGDGGALVGGDGGGVPGDVGGFLHWWMTVLGGPGGIHWEE